MAVPPAAIVSDSDLLLLAGVAQSVGAAPADLLASLYADSGLQTNAGASRTPPSALGIGLITQAEAMEHLGMNEAAWREIPNQSFVLQIGQIKHLFDGVVEGYPNAVALYQHRIAPLAVGPSILYRAPSPGYVTNSFLDTGKKGFIESEDLRQFLIARTTGTSFVDYMKRLQVVSGTPGALPRIPIAPIVSSNDASIAVTATETPGDTNSLPWGTIALACAGAVGAFFLYKQLRPSTDTAAQGASSGSDDDDEGDE